MPRRRAPRKKGLQAEPEKSALVEGLRPIQLKSMPARPGDVARLAAASAGGDLVLPFEVDELPGHVGADHPYSKQVNMEIRRGWVGRLVNRGYTRLEIAGFLNVSPSTVDQDLQRLLGEWQELRVNETDSIVTQLLQNYLETFRQAEDGWESSRGAEETVVEESGTRDDKPFDTRKVTRKENRDGNPAFLAQKLRSLDSVVKLLGLDNPESGDGGDIEVNVTFVEKPLPVEAPKQPPKKRKRADDTKAAEDDSEVD